MEGEQLARLGVPLGEFSLRSSRTFFSGIVRFRSSITRGRLKSTNNHLSLLKSGNVLLEVGAFKKTTIVGAISAMTPIGVGRWNLAASMAIVDKDEVFSSKMKALKCQ